MVDNAGGPSGWLYPDRQAWESLLRIRPKPQPVLAKPSWWRGRWPDGAAARTTNGSSEPRQVLDRVRRELAWARKCFCHAQSVLPDSSAKNKAARIGDTLARVRKAVDTPEKAEDVVRAIDELAAMGRHDPEKYPRSFVETAAASLGAAGAILAASRFGAIAYWGRVLSRSSGFFRSMGHELPGG
jgi:hypothetical protein